MVNSKFSQEVTKVLDKLAEVIISNTKDAIVAPVQEVPTEKLITDMQSILVELKSRVTASSTLTLHELPVGSKVQDSLTQYYGAPITWLVADHGYYGPTLTSLVSERILTFKAFDAAEPNNPDRWRSDYGNNDYKVSNIGLWLNSYKEDWFTPLHEYDQAPTEEYVYGNPYADEKGFLTNFSEDFIRNINDSVQGKVFLLSAEEVGLSDGGKPLDLFENEEFRKAKPTKECVQIDQEGDENEPDWWWLRTPSSGSSGSVRRVFTSGALIGGFADFGNRGARPLLNLSSEIRVKAEPNENGIYEIIWGQVENA